MVVSPDQGRTRARKLGTILNASIAILINVAKTMKLKFGHFGEVRQSCCLIDDMMIPVELLQGAKL